MSPEEERLVVDLHARWGNRWSRIAKAMPGRTDNEIKNYWRTHTRKLHKDNRAAADGAGSAASASTTTSTSMSAASPATTSSSSSSTTHNDNHSHHGHRDQETAASQEQEQADQQLLYTAGIGMDNHLLWNDALMDTYAWGAVATPSMIVPPPSSPVWDYCCSDSLWGIGDDEVEYKKMLAVAGAS